MIESFIAFISLRPQQSSIKQSKDYLCLTVGVCSYFVIINNLIDILILNGRSRDQTTLTHKDGCHWRWRRWQDLTHQVLHPWNLPWRAWTHGTWLLQDRFGNKWTKVDCSNMGLCWIRRLQSIASTWLRRSRCFHTVLFDYRPRLAQKCRAKVAPWAANDH